MNYTIVLEECGHIHGLMSIQNSHKDKETGQPIGPDPVYLSLLYVFLILFNKVSLILLLRLPEKTSI